MRFVHAADLHIDSPLRGLERYEGAPVELVRGATRRALSNLVDLCLSEEAAFLLLAGDIFDGDWKDYGTGLFFVGQMARLRQAGIPVYLVRGNHDAASQVTRYLTYPDNVHEMAAQRPETVVLDHLGVAIHGQSFATRAVTDDLSLGYPAPVKGALNVGLLHTCAEGRPGHDAYAPCSVTGLIDRGYDYWALGHVHAREVLSRSPWVVFPGNLQGRQARESGPEGATLVTVENGRITTAEARALDAVRWTPLQVDAREARSPDDALQMTRVAFERAAAEAEQRLVAAPVTMHVSAPVQRRLLAEAERWTQQLRAVAIETSGDGLWVERVRFVHREQGDDDEGAVSTGGRAVLPASAARDAVTQLLAASRELRGDELALAGLGEELAELRRKLPAELREGAADEGLRLEEPETLRRLLEEVDALVVGRLGLGDADLGEGG